MLPLQGVRIVSFNHYLAGPLGVQILADMGADVIAVEPITGAWHRQWGGANRKVDGESVLFLAANRNKRSLALNLKSQEGVRIAKDLLRSADVLAENFRPGVLDRMGLGYEQLRQEMPTLIYASVSGYGQDGPYAKLPGQDLLVQALSGLATITGNTEDKARTIGVSVVDHHGAALFAAGILGALVARSRSGTGCRVDVDLLSAGLDLQTESLVAYFNGGARPTTVNPPPYIGGWHYSAPYGIYPTSDGQIAISLTPIDRLAGPLAKPELAEFSEEAAYTRRGEIAPVLAAALRARSTAEWERILTEADVWHARVNDYEGVSTDPQVVHNHSLTEIDGATGSTVTLVGNPVRYNGQQMPIRTPPQPLGAQTEEILLELGLSSERISELKDSGVILVGETPQHG